MAIGWPAGHSVTFATTADQASLHLASLQAVSALGWERTRVSESEVHARVPMSLLSWGEVVSIAFSPGAVRVTSRCHVVRWLFFAQVFDRGKNQANVDAFVEALQRALTACKA